MTSDSETIDGIKKVLTRFDQRILELEKAANIVVAPPSDEIPLTARLRELRNKVESYNWQNNDGGIYHEVWVALNDSIAEIEAGRKLLVMATEAADVD